MNYEKPTVVDFGDLVDMTLATGQVGSEDGAGKTVQAGVGGVVEVSIGILP